MSSRVRQKRLARERASAQLASIEAELRQHIKSALPSATNPGNVGGVIRGLRALGALALPAAERKVLRARLVKSLAQVMRDRDFKLEATDLGARDLEHLAEMFVRMLERVHYSSYGITELRRKARGLRGIFAGELFEQLVLNLKPLQKAFRGMARGQLEDLKRLLAEERAHAGPAGPSAKARVPRLLDALGAPIGPLPAGGKFTEIQQATDIFIHVNGKKLKFVDFAYISYFGTSADPRQRITFLVETEIKLSRAAAKFSEQIGVAQARFAGAERVEMVVAGETISIPPDRIIFDRGSINRTAVTIAPSPSDTSSFRDTTKAAREAGVPVVVAPSDTYSFRHTTKGGYAETYLRIGLTIKVDELRRLVNLLFRP